MISYRLLMLRSLVLCATLAIIASARAQLSFSFTEGATLAGLSTTDPLVYSNVRNGFQAAANRWSGLLGDNVTLNLVIDFPALPANILGSASSVRTLYDYSTVRSALIGDAQSGDDLQAMSTLAAGPGFTRWINYTNDNPNGVGSATSYLDNSQTQLRLSNANAKALGLPTTGNDATIRFNSDPSTTWDFDPSDGIASGAYDFVGVATHEIGHSLGFLSGVDALDINSPSNNQFYDASQFSFTTALDLFRYSASSAGVIDSAAGTTAYFSLNGGATNLALFSTGINHGDGNQASHWKRSRARLGIMDPTSAPGESGVISALDLRALDVIGWNLASVAAPEPGTLGLIVFGLIVSGTFRKIKSNQESN
jgi:hypothetical protein